MADKQLSQRQTSNTVIFDVVVSSLTGELDFVSIDYIHKVYRSSIQSTSIAKINYNKKKYQKAYLYMYFTSLTRAVEHFCSGFYSAFKNMKTINICSIGGGPGTEIFGFKLFLTSKNIKARIEGTILEYYVNWENTYEEIQSKLNFNDVDLKYKYFDFTKQIDQTSIDAIKKADLVTLVKIVSGLQHYPDCEENLTKLLLAMKPGALVLFIDNSKGGYYEIMEKAASSAELTYWFNEEFERKSFISNEEQNKMTMVYGRKTLSPQQNLSVRVIVCEKPVQTNQVTVSTVDPHIEGPLKKKLRI